MCLPKPMELVEGVYESDSGGEEADEAGIQDGPEDFLSDTGSDSDISEEPDEDMGEFLPQEMADYFKSLVAKIVKDGSRIWRSICQNRDTDSKWAQLLQTSDSEDEDDMAVYYFSFKLDHQCGKKEFEDDEDDNGGTGLPT